MQTEQRPLNLAGRPLVNLLTGSGLGRKRWTLEGSREGSGGEMEAAHVTRVMCYDIEQDQTLLF